MANCYKFSIFINKCLMFPKIAKLTCSKPYLYSSITSLNNSATCNGGHPHTPTPSPPATRCVCPSLIATCIINRILFRKIVPSSVLNRKSSVVFGILIPGHAINDNLVVEGSVRYILSSVSNNTFTSLAYKASFSRIG